MSARIGTARAYLKALEENGDALAFFTPDAVQEEFPNRLNPNGGVSDLETMKRRSEQGRAMVRWQRYEVLAEYESSDTVVLEVNWSAAFNVVIGSLQPGDTMKARFAVFLDFEGGQIRRQRNYDCFEPF